MEQILLAAQKREVMGRKVKTLRKQGLLPAHIYGHKIETIHVQVKAADFKKVFEQAGETGIVDLQLDGTKHPTLIRNIQIHPVTDEILHIDFYQVNLTEKVKVNVPLEIAGEAPAEQKKVGLLLTPVSEIEVEALPTDLPESIEVDVSKLENIGDEIRVKDLPIDKSKVEVLAEEELVVASIGELITKEQQELEAEIEAEAAEAAPAETAEGAASEGETAAGEPRPEGREKTEGEVPTEGERTPPAGTEKGEDKGQEEKPKEDK